MFACLYKLNKYFSPLALHFLNITQVISLKHKEHTTNKRAVRATGNLLQNSSTNGDKYLLVKKAPQPPQYPRWDQDEYAAVSLSSQIARLQWALLSGFLLWLQTSLPASTIQPSVTACKSRVCTMLTSSVSLTQLKNYSLDTYLN